MYTFSEPHAGATLARPPHLPRAGPLHSPHVGHTAPPTAACPPQPGKTPTTKRLLHHRHRHSHSLSHGPCQSFQCGPSAFTTTLLKCIISQAIFFIINAAASSATTTAVTTTTSSPPPLVQFISLLRIMSGEWKTFVSPLWCRHGM